MDSNHDQALLGSVPLYLADAGKSVETTPNGIGIGMIKLRSWLLYLVEPVPPGFEGHAAYLIRVNYEFDIAPDVPSPDWAEVEFQFGQTVMVVDAVPRAVTKAAGASEYELTEKLTFVPAGRRANAGRMTGIAADGIAMPPVLPRIDCFGLGGDSIRWRHGGGVPAGTHSGWLALLTPPGFSGLQVVAGGEYRVKTDPRLKLRPASRRDAFCVRLPGSAASAPTAIGASARSPDGRRVPRVFVSYAQEPPAHKQAVARLCVLLADQGVNVSYDQQDLDSRRNWDTWTTTQILRSDYVIAVASPAYQGVGDGTLPADEHPGLRSEYLRLADLLYRYRETWTKKILPVVLPGRSHNELPLSFLPGTSDYYEIKSFTPDGAADLLRVLWNGAPPS